MNISVFHVDTLLSGRRMLNGSVICSFLLRSSAHYTSITSAQIDGYTKRGAYIATQGPLDITLADFWRMVWENESNVILMLTELIENGRAKSDQYVSPAVLRNRFLS